MSVRMRITATATTLLLGSGVGVALAPTADAASPAPRSATASTERVAPGADAHRSGSHSCYKRSFGYGCGYYNKTWRQAAYTEIGDSGSRVKEIQKVINDTTRWPSTGHARLTVDGHFGGRTRSAVRWFQDHYMAAGNVDGKVGPKTWKALRWAENYHG